MNLCKQFTALFLILFLIPAVSFAAPVETVTNTNDAGPGSLRQSLADVDPLGEVRFDASIDGMTIALTSGELVIDKQISINTANATNVTLDGSASPDLNVLRIADLAITVFIGALNITGNGLQTALVVGSGVTLTGQGIRTFDTLRGVEVRANSRFDAFSCTFDNHSNEGVLVFGGSGAVFGGVLSCFRCLMSNNTDGVIALGGLDTNADGGSAGVSQSLLINNLVGMSARGGQDDSAEGGHLTSRHSTFQNNSLGSLGAFSGIQSSALGGSMEVLNTTFTGNGITIFVEGGVTENALGGTAKVSFSTINMNTYGLQVDPPNNGNNAQIDVKNTIVSESSNMDCDATMSEIVATGLNFDTDGTCNALDVDFTTAAPAAINLGPLQDNGGMTETFDLIIPSAAIDAAPDCTDVDGDDVDLDQRLFPRPFAPSCDLGAVEQQPTGMLTLTKLSIPSGGTNFLFTTTGFPLGCEFSTLFSLDDGETESCILPLGVVMVTELLANDSGVIFDCTEQPVNQTFDSVTLDIGAGDNVTCTLTNDMRPFILNPIFPSIASNPNLISAEEATAGGPVAFLWGFMAGNVTIGGPTCNGLVIDINNPKVLAIVSADGSGFAEHIFWIPLIGDFELPVMTQAVDVDTCRKSEKLTNIIRKE